jgi:hypothetical protein
MMFKKLIVSIHTHLKKINPLVPLILMALLYTFSHRTLNEILEQALPMAIFIAITSYGFFIGRWSLFGLPRISIHLFLLPIIYLPLLVILSTIVYFSLWVLVKDGYIWFEQQSPPRGVYVAMTAILVLAVGFALYIFRLFARFFFGLAEALFGLLIALWKVPVNADPLLWSSDVYIAMITASIFLIVRGFDNMHIGLKNGDAIIKGFMETEYGELYKSLLQKDQSPSNKNHQIPKEPQSDQHKNSNRIEQ